MPGLIEFGQFEVVTPHDRASGARGAPSEAYFRALGGRLTIFSTDSYESDAKTRREEM